MTAGLPFPNNASVVTRYLRSKTHLKEDCAICPTSTKARRQFSSGLLWLYFIWHRRDNDNQVNRANMPHVILPKELAKTLPKTRLLSENEWRSIGVQQSRGWQHYAIHRPEPHILLFRRPLGTDPQTGAIDPELKRLALEEYKGQFGLRGH
eukprot:scaffold13271_cov157-Skeletonema_marinoi.AAC.2